METIMITKLLASAALGALALGLAGSANAAPSFGAGLSATNTGPAIEKVWWKRVCDHDGDRCQNVWISPDRDHDHDRFWWRHRHDRDDRRFDRDDRR